MVETGNNRKEVELKDCPFCGEPSVKAQEGHAGILFIVCDACSAVVSFRSFPNGPDAIKAYNTRLAL